MEIRVDPARFSANGFSLEAAPDTKGNDFYVLIDGLIAGRLMEQTTPNTSSKWWWTLTGPYLPPELLPSNGHANSRDEAEEALKEKFSHWHRWAGMLEGPAVWYGTPSGATPEVGQRGSGSGPGPDGLVKPGGDSGQPGGSQHHRGGRFS